jgi:catechol 2,3-dioxygenase-like lactoylglutathione lyase family enzyme
VADLDKTLEFYHDLVGLVVLHQDEGPIENPAYGRLTNTITATYKTATVAIPNQRWTLNLVEYIGIPREQIKQREQDPGDPGLTLTVKNSSAISNALRAANLTTILGEPIPEGGEEGTTSTVWVYDPDGYMVELVQRSGPSDYFTVSPPNITNGPGMEFVIRGQLDLTLSNATQAITFYRDILGQNITRGFDPLIGPGYEALGFVGTIFNMSADTQWAAVTGNCDPDTRCEYYEYDAPDRVSIVYRRNTLVWGSRLIM